jgi:putative transposase
MGRLYANRFLAPLQSEGEFAAELRESVLTWLHQGRNIPRAAQTLNVHVNTLRYRLRRYADLTGADFDDLDDLIGVAWALELGDPDQG